MRFWDSSAIVPLVVSQPQSAAARAWLAEDDAVAIWTLTPVEVTSALWRLVRATAMDESDALRAEALLAEVATRASVVIDLEGAKANAARMLRVHPLRAADALQLSAALLWADGAPKGRVIHTFDRNLGAAALREGFRVDQA